MFGVFISTNLILMPASRLDSWDMGNHSEKDASLQCCWAWAWSSGSVTYSWVSWGEPVAALCQLNRIVIQSSLEPACLSDSLGCKLTATELCWQSLLLGEDISWEVASCSTGYQSLVLRDGITSQGHKQMQWRTFTPWKCSAARIVSMGSGMPDGHGP